MGINRKFSHAYLDPSKPDSLSSRMRRKRIRPLVAEIDRVFREKGAVRILDLGGDRVFWENVLGESLSTYKMHVTIVNLDVENADDGPVFSARRGDACDLDIEDFSFDICHSNSVIEHVGGTREMERFARTARRAAPAYFVQTPNYWFPVEPHYMLPFVHWLPRPTAIGLLRGRKLGLYLDIPADQVGAMRAYDANVLLDARSMAGLFPDAEIIRERFGLLTKSIIAYRAGGRRRSDGR